MSITCFDLPEIKFVGGSCEELRFNLCHQSGAPFNATGCTVNFSIVDYSNKFGSPLLSKAATLKKDSTGLSSIAIVNLISSDTKALYGKFIYQLTVKTSDGVSKPILQGIAYIYKNINPSFIT